MIILSPRARKTKNLSVIDSGISSTFRLTCSKLYSYLKNKLNLFHGYAHEFSGHLKHSNFISWFDVKHDILKPSKEKNKNTPRLWKSRDTHNTQISLSTSLNNMVHKSDRRNVAINHGSLGGRVKWKRKIDLMRDYVTCPKSPPSLVCPTFFQTFVAFELFSRGYSFALCCFGDYSS